ncbi:hypothetical protein MUP65_00300 [Patescibacteria group bacterium]|nr:hypothetical protein [Patescibacteria group bacterium]
MDKKKTAGVSAVIIIGVIAVLLTIVVPLISRTVVDLRISRQQEEQARAFSVAETGLERVLTNPGETGLYSATIDEIEYTVTNQRLGNDDFYQYPKNISQQTPVTVWLVSHQTDVEDFDQNAPWNETIVPIFEGDELTVYWGLDRVYNTNDERPALEATLVYRDGAEYATKRYLLDSVNRTETGGFDTTSVDVGATVGIGDEEKKYAFQALLSDLNCNEVDVCYFLRLRILYSPGLDHPIGVSKTGEIFPRQGECFDSLATVVDSGISSRVKRCVLYRDFPPILDFAMYSGGALGKE